MTNPAKKAPAKKAPKAKTPEQVAAAAKREEAKKAKQLAQKEKDKARAAKEKDEEKRVEARVAIAAIKVPAAEVTAARKALARINAAPLAVRADYLRIGQLFVDGKAYCLKPDGTVNNATFGAWLEKINFGNDVIDKSKRSNIIWMTEKQEAIAKNSEDVLDLMGDEISPNRYRAFFRNLTVDQCADTLYTEMGFDAVKRSEVTQITEAEGEGEGEEKAEKEFDHKAFTARTVATLMDKFEGNSPELEHFIGELRVALDLITAVTETEDEANAA